MGTLVTIVHCPFRVLHGIVNGLHKSQSRGPGHREKVFKALLRPRFSSFQNYNKSRKAIEMHYENKKDTVVRDDTGPGGSSCTFPSIAHN